MRTRVEMSEAQILGSNTPLPESREAVRSTMSRSSKVNGDRHTGLVMEACGAG